MIPGKELQKFLKSRFNDKEAAFSQIDGYLYEDGEFLHYMYMSAINYLIRRFINTAEFYKRKFPPQQYSSSLYIDKLRSFFEENTSFNKEEVDTILTFLISSLDEKRGQKKGTRNMILREGKRSKNSRCFICGHELYFDRDDIYSATVEHIWPLAMGGSNDAENLKLACRKCNAQKDYYIDSSDFHFEEISIVNRKGSGSFSKSFKWKFRVALWAKSDYSCAICNKPAEKGSLHFARQNENDSWHFLNINTYCEEHFKG